MSFTLSLDTNTGARCPFWFTNTDSKSLVHFLVENHVWGNSGPDVIGLCAARLHLDIAPLKKIAGEDWDLEEYLEHAGDDAAEHQRAEEAWKHEQAKNANAWQAPSTLRTCLAIFINALEKHPHVFTELGVTNTYFIKGFFRKDLLDLLHMTAWAQEQEITHVRISCM